MKKHTKLTDEEKAYIREHLPQSTCVQVAKRLGRTPSAVAKYAKRHGVSYNKALVAQIKAANITSVNWSEEHAKKISDAIKEKFRKDRRRLNWGLEQKTKWNVERLPRAITDARARLKWRHNYVMDDLRIRHDDPYNIYYDSETKRTPNEAYFTKKYGFKFIPLEE